MTKKKTSTPTPTKKAAPKKKENKPTWKQIGEAHIPGLGTVKEFDVKFTQNTSPSAQDILDAVTAENYALKQLLSKTKQSEDMPQVELKGKPMLSTPILDVLLSDLDKNISRFYNGMNALDSFADRLKPSDQGQMPIGSTPPPPPSVISRMERLLSDFNHLNNRLEATNNYLSEII